MSNENYDEAFSEMLGANGLDWLGGTFKIALVQSSYTFDRTHAFTDVASHILDASHRSASLASKTLTGGIADCADADWTSATAASGLTLVLYKDLGVDSSNIPITYYDTGQGIPVTTDGSSFSIETPSGVLVAVLP